MAQGKAIEPEVKAQVMAALLAGQSVSQVCEMFSVARATVTRMRQEIPDLVQLGTQKGNPEQIADKLTQYVALGLDCLMQQYKVLGDVEYLKTQSAAEIATSHGIVFDKIGRVLEAIARLEPANDTDNQTRGAS